MHLHILNLPFYRAHLLLRLSRGLFVKALLLLLSFSSHQKYSGSFWESVSFDVEQVTDHHFDYRKARTTLRIGLIMTCDLEEAWPCLRCC